MKIENIFTELSINIIIVFITMIFVLFIPDYLHTYFGDIYEKANHEFCGGNGEEKLGWTWGWRHWLWMWMGISLFIVQFSRIISIINKHLN